jgi:hypothetical protein
MVFTFTDPMVSVTDSMETGGVAVLQKSQLPRPVSYRVADCEHPVCSGHPLSYDLWSVVPSHQ